MTALEKKADIRVLELRARVNGRNRPISDINANRAVIAETSKIDPKTTVASCPVGFAVGGWQESPLLNARPET